MAGLRVERDQDVLRVTLARPERRNAFDAQLIADLTAAFSDVGDARAVVLAGEGETFCAGADIEAIDVCRAPVVARVQGYALGGGSGLAACADIAVAASDATFGFTEVKLGIVPAVISPFVLPKIGQHARRYFLTGERFDAQTALRIGLVHEVTDELDSTVQAIVDQLLSSGPKAARAAKDLIRERPDGRKTAEIAARMRTSEEGQGRLRAFLDRRS